MNDNPAVPPEAVATLAAHFGVPPDAVPVLARLDVQPGSDATGWVATTTDVRRVRVPASPDWPAGQLDIVGGLVEQVPDDPARPFLYLEGLAAISGYAAQLHIPSGRAMVEVTWSVGPRTARIELTGDAWTDDDLAAASAAARWLQGLPRAGGHHTSEGTR